MGCVPECPNIVEHSNENSSVVFDCQSFFISAFAAEGKSVSYKSGDETVNGMLYEPVGKGPFPALIVIHEFWGLNGWVKDQASKLADQGYAALAIDLYRGKVADTPDMGHELMRGVPPDRATRRPEGGLRFSGVAAQCEEGSNRIDWVVHGWRLFAGCGDR